MGKTNIGGVDIEVPNHDEQHPMAIYKEQFVHAWQGHGDTISAITNKGRIFVRHRDRKDTGPVPVMRWYEVKAPDFSAEFERHTT